MRGMARARQAALSVAILALAACAAAPKPVAAPPAPPPLDASYDWHVLLVAPFGSVLKDVPLTLHEVLLFRDEARTAAHSRVEQGGSRRSSLGQPAGGTHAKVFRPAGRERER